MNPLSFLLRRARYHWQMLLTLSLGVFLATILLAGAPILLQTVVEFGLQRNLLTAPPLSANVELSAFPDRGMTLAEYESFAAEMEAVAAEHLGAHTGRIIPTAELRWLFPWVEGEIIEEEAFFVRFYGRPDESHIAAEVQFLAGGWPEEVVIDSENGVFAAVISEEAAAAYGVQVGERIPLAADRSDREPQFWIEVAGIARPANPLDRAWFGELSPLRTQSNSRWTTAHSALVPAADLFTLNEQLFDFRPTLTWRVLLDPASFHFADIPAMQAALTALDFDLRSLDNRPALATELDTILENFAAQTAAIRPPLYLLSVEVVLLALYYVIMVAALSVRQVEGEFAVLRSRGASSRQILLLQLGEALLICLLAFLSGPLLAVLTIQALAFFGPLGDVAQVEWAWSIPAGAWLAALGGVLISLVVLLLPAGSAVQRSVVTQRQLSARDSRPMWFQRYYLDVILLAAGFLLLWRLQAAGNLAGEAAAQVDWLLLLSPVLLLLGAGTILLRLFPFMLHLAARLAAARPGLPAALAMWQAARNPSHIARLVLLLTLAMALGLLAGGLNATLDLSEFERARYQAGGEIRLTGSQGLSAPAVAEAAEVEIVSGAFRNEGTATLGRLFYRYNLLGVEPFSLAEVALFRPDFAARPVGELLGQLVVETEPLPAVTLPGNPGEISLWVWAPPDNRATGGNRGVLLGNSDLDRIGLQAKLQTARGEIVTVALKPVIEDVFEGTLSTILLSSGTYPPNGWREFSAEIPIFAEDDYPLQLHSLWFQNRARSASTFLPVQILVAVDMLAVTDRQTGRESIVAVFEAESQDWHLDDPASFTRFVSTNPRDGAERLDVGLNYTRSLQWLGLKPGPAGRAAPEVPVLVSNAFLQETGLQSGETFLGRVDALPVNFVIAGRVTYFPTMEEDPEKAGFVVAARDPLLVGLNESSRQAYNANELMFTGAAGVPVEQVSAAATGRVSGFDRLFEAETIRKTMKADPMALGLRSVTLFGYLLTTLLSLVGFATYFYMSARRHAPHYAVLRAIGMSPRQLYSTLALEQVVLILSGLALGTVLGVVLNRLVLPGLPITLGDRPPIPPFIAQNDWGAVLRIYLSLAVAFLLTLGLATGLLWRTRLHRALRIGEE